MVLICCLLLLYLHDSVLSYLFNKCPNFSAIFLLLCLDAAAHIDAPGANLGNGPGHFSRRETAGQQDGQFLRDSACRAPIMSNAAAAPACRWRVEQDAPCDASVGVNSLSIIQASQWDGFNDGSLNLLAECR